MKNNVTASSNNKKTIGIYYKIIYKRFLKKKKFQLYLKTYNAIKLIIKNIH